MAHLRDRAADVLGAEDLSEDVVAAVYAGGLRSQHVVQQAAAAEAAQHAGEAIQSRRLRLRLFLEAAEQRRQQRRGAARRLVLADTKFARHRLDSADLTENVRHLHDCLLPWMRRPKCVRFSDLVQHRPVPASAASLHRSNCERAQRSITRPYARPTAPGCAPGDRRWLLRESGGPSAPQSHLGHEAQACGKVDEHIQRKEIDAAAHQIRHAGLRDTGNGGRARLCELAAPLEFGKDAMHDLRTKLQALGGIRRSLDRIPIRSNRCRFTVCSS